MVLREGDGVQSLIRVIDRAFIGRPALEMPPQHLNLVVAITLKAGEARGPIPFKLRPEGPDGSRRAPFEMLLVFEGEGDRGHNVNIDLKRIALDQPGLWWFDLVAGPG